ncbi:MAG: cyclic nucleotide-binding domain-containing protein [Nitrospina sp.]|jgi:CRP-like cAMP-binding protein|nr:cyclic nucleotide-binding domain-containing protein [Nitrospina sp.]MBT3508594.1 cyclic nucleotide-binding domain-containing protein [Nitrospina sp.]MBT3875370.1 cyclic nucleotide-binding domain-containing protein [Nitrospina sp.]MBT4048545.1 cyclic nucleotide-binding domain-containing protein [Nitrospina sp.]MBT4558973.1 cyclic nucleotide-binding domain-containing protein [Nitrospina sp.]
MDISKDLEALKKTSFSNFFEELELERIFNAGKQIFLKKGQVLFSEGSFQETMYIILAGKVEIYKKHKQIAVRGTGDFLGEMALVESKPRSASVRALANTEVLEIEKDTFFKYFASNPKVVWEILKAVSARNRDDLEIIEGGYQEIRNSREKYRKVIDSVSDLIIQTDPDGKINFANKAVSFIGFDVFDLIGRDFNEFYDGDLSSSSRAHILTRRVGPRTTSDLEVSFKVNEQSTLYDFCNSMSFMLTATGMWSVPHEMVMKKGTNKEFQGTLLVARKEKNGGYRMV